VRLTGGRKGGVTSNHLFYGDNLDILREEGTQFLLGV
jgi:hypothetical protein